MRGLADRRFQMVRAKRRALRLLRWLFADPGDITTRMVASRAVDRTPCSCWMCGNPRRFTGEPTRRERLAADGFPALTARP